MSQQLLVKKTDRSTTAKDSFPRNVQKSQSDTNKRFRR